MTHWALFVLCLAAFGALAMATDRAQQDLLGHELPLGATRSLRLAGWLLLLLALATAVTGLGWALGLVAYSGHTSAAAGLVFLALVAWNRRKAR